MVLAATNDPLLTMLLLPWFPLPVALESAALLACALVRVDTAVATSRDECTFTVGSADSGGCAIPPAVVLATTPSEFFLPAALESSELSELVDDAD